MKIYYNDLSQEKLEIAESVLFTGSGNIGMRNTLVEENYNFFKSERATYINGFYETKPITYPEKCYGFATTGESMINVIDTQLTHIFVGEKKLNILDCKVIEHERYLDLTNGCAYRMTIFEDENGNQTKFEHTRLISFVTANLIIEKFKFTKINHQLPIKLINRFQYKTEVEIDVNDPRVNHDLMAVNIDQVNLKSNSIEFSTEQSKLSKVLNYNFSQQPASVEQLNDALAFTFELQTDQFVKCVTYQNTVQLIDIDVEEEFQKQQKYLTTFWENAKIQIVADVEIEASVNYGTYALLQSVGRDGFTSIAAKGLSGNGYEGHYFWDSEMYVLPVFTNLQPAIARDMLQYRINKLDQAIANREMIGYETGALFPWRTISGQECSAFFEAGMAQHHINCDICYGLIDYYQKTRDVQLMIDGGFKLLLETSRFFASIMYEKDGMYHLDKVTGPDEYSTLVNDNLYTNCMVSHQLKNTVLIYNQLQSQLPSVEQDELILFEKIADNIAIKYDEERKIIWQDRDFLNKQLWPYNSENKHPLLMHYHPLEIYRYQVSKQADAVLAMMLLPDMFEHEYIKNSVEYYDSVTTHDSSLSFSIYAIVYARINQLSKAYDYFLKNARLDLDNVHHNTKDGIHTAAMGGTYMTILYGFLGYEIVDNKPTINPKVPVEIKQIKLRVNYLSEIYEINVTPETAEITLINQEN